MSISSLPIPPRPPPVANRWLRLPKGGQSTLPPRDAFTLVEVVIALGIFAFVIVPIIGMIGNALSVSKDSVDASTAAQIFRVVEAYASTNTDTTLTGTNLYFNNYGEMMTNASAADAAYQVNFLTNTPSDSAQGLLAKRLVRVSIVRATATNVVIPNGTRFLQMSRDPSDLRNNYFWTD